MTIIPTDIYNKIMLYNSHPLADLFKKHFKDYIEDRDCLCALFGIDFDNEKIFGVYYLERLEDANDYKNHYHEYNKVSRAWDDVGDTG